MFVNRKWKKPGKRRELIRDDPSTEMMMEMREDPIIPAVVRSNLIGQKVRTCREGYPSLTGVVTGTILHKTGMRVIYVIQVDSERSVFCTEDQFEVIDSTRVIRHKGLIPQR
ncbi:MAG: hypothetical protein IKD66_01105 [Solobacterium sp.]|nr:hypothetical protein [Solobacterium sp.]